MNTNVIIGKKKNETDKPKKKYRVLVQERKTKDSALEKMRSFMVYDYSGRTTIDSVKKRLFKGLK